MSRSDLLPIEGRVEKALQQCFPDSPDPRFIIGVSGGPDSMCLLYIFKKLGVKGLAVHINYGKRGRESDKDAELVEQMALQWGFDCHSLFVHSGKDLTDNFQQWARTVRYDIFRALAKEHNAAGIAVAHHQDDQIETILQKQFRGAGLASWSGMSIWNGEIFRPLIHITRREIEAYIERENIPRRIDRSNLKSEFARNFLRNEWLAELEHHFPGWRQNVLRIAGQSALFGEAVEWVLAQLTDKQNRIDRQGLLEVSSGLRKALVLQHLKSVQPDIRIGTDALNELDSLDQLQTGKSVQLTEKLSLMRDRGYFRMQGVEPDFPQPVELSRDRLESGPATRQGITYALETFDSPDYEHRLYLDAGAMSWPLRLRRWKEGDRFRPFGMKGHQNVSDHLTNRKVSASEKGRTLVLESFEGIICAVIFPPTENKMPPGTISEHVRCDESTRLCLTVYTAHLKNN